MPACEVGAHAVKCEGVLHCRLHAAAPPCARSWARLNMHTHGDVPHAAPAALQRCGRRRGARRACPGQRATRAAPRRRPRGRSARPTAAARSPRRRAPRPAAAPSPAARAGRAGRRTRPPSRRCPRPACPPPLRSAARTGRAQALGSVARPRCRRATTPRPAARAAGQAAGHAVLGAGAPAAMVSSEAEGARGARHLLTPHRRSASQPRPCLAASARQARSRQRPASPGPASPQPAPQLDAARHRQASSSATCGGCRRWLVRTCRAGARQGGSGAGGHLIPRAPGCAGCWPRHRRGASAPSLRWPAAAVSRSASPLRPPARQRRSARARPAQRAPRFTCLPAGAAAASRAAGSAQHGRGAGSCGLPAVTNRSSAATGAAQHPSGHRLKPAYNARRTATQQAKKQYAEASTAHWRRVPA